MAVDKRDRAGGELMIGSEYSCHSFNNNNNGNNKVSLEFIPSCQIHARDILASSPTASSLSSPRNLQVNSDKKHHNKHKSK